MRAPKKIGVVLVLLLATAGSSRANLLTNGNAETGDLTGWVDPLGHGFNVGSLAVLPAITPVDGTYEFWAGITGPANGPWTNEIRQDVDVSSLSAVIDAGAATANFDGWGRSAESGGAHDDAAIIVEYLDAGQIVLDAFSSGMIMPFNNWVHVTDPRLVPVGTRTIRVRLTGVRSGGASTDALFDALSLTVETPVGVGGTPQRYALSVSNFPNPFNPRTTVSYTVPSRALVTVVIYDARGARVATLLNGEVRASGAHRLDWNGRDERGAMVPSGVYFVRIEQNGATRMKNMVLLK